MRIEKWSVLNLVWSPFKLTLSSNHHAPVFIIILPRISPRRTVMAWEKDFHVMLSKDIILNIFHLDDTSLLPWIIWRNPFSQMYFSILLISIKILILNSCITCFLVWIVMKINYRYLRNLLRSKFWNCKKFVFNYIQEQRLTRDKNYGLTIGQW